MASATPPGRWLYRPQPLAKVAVLRTIVGLYLPLDLFIRTSQVVPHSYGSSQLYDPVHVLAFLHQPAPVPWFAQSLRAMIIALGPGHRLRGRAASPRLGPRRRVRRLDVPRDVIRQGRP